MLYIDNIIKKTVDCPNPLNTNLNILRKNLDANQIFIAHRLGGITERQENNILFFEDALKRGFNFFETDIYVYEDQLYLYHPKDNQTQSDILKIINKDKSLNDFDDLINKIKSINANILVILDIKNNQNRLDIFNLIEKKTKPYKKKFIIQAENFEEILYLRKLGYDKELLKTDKIKKNIKSIINCANKLNIDNISIHKLKFDLYKNILIKDYKKTNIKIYIYPVNDFDYVNSLRQYSFFGGVFSKYVLK